MFDGFTEFDLSTAEGSVHGRRGGAGPPVLLLHGIPETHLMWHRVAPVLADAASRSRSWPGSASSASPWLDYWDWSLLAAPAPIPERLLAAEPADPAAFPDQLRAAYVEPFRDPATVAAICGSTAPPQRSTWPTTTRTRDGAPSGAPFWCCGARWAPRPRGTTPLAIWGEWAADVSGTALHCGHFLPEEAPQETTRHLLAFLGRAGR